MAFSSPANSGKGLKADKSASVCWVLPDVSFYHHARIENFAHSHDGRVTILEVSDTSRFPQFKRGRAGDESYNTVTLFKGRHYEQIAKPELLAAVMRTLNDIHPEVLIIQGWGLSYSLAAHNWAAAKSVPVVLTCESAREDKRRVRVREWVKSRIVRLCASALVGGRSHADYVTGLGMPRERIFFGYDVVENNHFQQGAESARQRSRELRIKHGLPQNYFLASGRFVEKKNFPSLLQAFARFQELRAKKVVIPHSAATNNAGHWSLVLLGDGPLRESLTSLRSSLGLQQSVLMPGFKDYAELPVFYGLAGAFVHASITEQWGLVVNEAMASGLPVLVSNRCGCARDLVETAANGFTFAPYDVQDLARWMLCLAEMEVAVRAKFGQESCRIVSGWGPERFASGFKAAVNCALYARRKGACLFDRMLLRLLMGGGLW